MEGVTLWMAALAHVPSALAAQSLEPDVGSGGRARPAGEQTGSKVSVALRAAPQTLAQAVDSAGQKLPPENVSAAEKTALSQNRPLDPTAPTDEVVVKSGRARGSVVSNIPPERTLTPFDITALGADDVGTLIRGIGAQAGSNRGENEGRPVVLLNGRRVSSFAEISKIPSEAIERVEIFPEEVALSYGFSPEQKVVNVVTFETFASRVVQSSYAASTEGSYSRFGVSGNIYSINRSLQANFNIEYFNNTQLTELGRNIEQPPSRVGEGAFRTLLPSSRNLALNGRLSRPIADNVAVSIDGRFDAERNWNLLGRETDGLLARDVDTNTAHLGATLNGRVGRWLWSAIGSYDQSDIKVSNSIAERRSFRDETVSTNTLGTAELLANGPLIELPAGTVNLGLRTGLSKRDFAGKTRSAGVVTSTVLKRGQAQFQANLDVPISKRGRGASILGRLTANTNFAVEEISDFRLLRTFGYGLYWLPIDSISVYVSTRKEERAPLVEQLGAPLLQTPNVRIFDFIRQETVDVTRLSGGNGNLLAEDRSVVAFGIYAKPLGGADLTLSVDFNRTQIDDPIASFPIATADVQAAFPGRFQRDSAGRLLQIDARPLNLGQADQSRIRSGINFSQSLGAGPPLPKGMTITGMQLYPNEEAMRAATPPGVVIIEVPSGSDDAERIEALASRLTFSLYHTFNLEDRFRSSARGPAFDLLNGAAIGTFGGTPRHEFELQVGLFKRGIGARLTTSWRSGTTVRGLPADTAAASNVDLRFAAYSIANLNLFAIPAQRIGPAAPTWLRGARVNVVVNNLLNNRPKVVDSAGTTPLNFQGAYLEPLGRTVSIAVRKAF